MYRLGDLCAFFAEMNNIFKTPCQEMYGPTGRQMYNPPRILWPHVYIHKCLA